MCLNLNKKVLQKNNPKVYKFIYLNNNILNNLTEKFKTKFKFK